MLRLVSKVSTRIVVLAALALGALALIGYLVAQESRSNLYAQKKSEIRHIVEAAISIVADYEKRAAAGDMTREEAQAQAKRVLAGLRYAGNEYVFVLDFDHRMVVHPIKPDQVGRDRTQDKDAAGKLFVQEFIATAKQGGGLVTYGFQKPQSTEFEDKVSYVAAYTPWRWVLGSGVLIEDVEAMHQALMRKLLARLGAAALLLAAAAFLVTRSITRPLSRLTGSLSRLATGDVGATVEGAKRRDELGTIARAVLDVRAAVSRRIEEQMAQEQDAKAVSEKERRRMLTDVARSLDQQVKAIAHKVGRAADDLLATARSMEVESGEARREAGSAAEASGCTAEQVAEVAQATMQLDSAIAEIGTHARDSSQVAKDAVVQIREASMIVSELANASSNIGKVVAMIHAIAEQTNLLALNATIEAARAGEAGRGFSVVASEVKQLAAQTTKATEEISSRIEAVVGATGDAVRAIESVDRTIGRIEGIASAIAATVEQQGAATAHISQAVARTIDQTKTLAASLDGLLRASSSTNASSKAVVGSASGLAGEAKALKDEVEQFVTRVAV